MRNMYVSDVIGEDYKQMGIGWNWGSVLLLNTPTGSGKTTFIFKKFLAYIIEKGIQERKKGYRLLYLVNRSILKEQLERGLPGWTNALILKLNIKSIQEYITIATYQSIEKGLLQENMYSTINWLNSFDYVVYDECHYFYNDSNFNTYTELSFRYLMQCFNTKVQIFMSATIENMEYFIKRECRPLDGYLSESVRFKQYTMEPNYDSVRLIVFNTREEMKQLVLEQKAADKWLIFIDSIKEGKELEEFLSKELEESNSKKGQVVFIDAKYANNEDSAQTVDKIAATKKAPEKIIITTAVMDNGISLEDYELRNIVILADTKESFIQMLGRKRPDGREINLYICKRDIEHFKRRKQYADAILAFYSEYAEKLDNENNRDNMAQQRFLERIYENKIAYKYARKITYPFCGGIYINQFSIRKYRQLSLFYNEMIDQLEKDKDAFVKQQAEWLCMDSDSVEQFIQESDDEIDRQHRKDIEGILEDYLNKELLLEDRLNMKLKLRDHLRHFIPEKLRKESKDDKNIYNYLGQNDRPISKEDFNYCMELADLQYEMKKLDHKKEIKNEKGETIEVKLYSISKKEETSLS